jgi:hypothetical protein
MLQCNISGRRRDTALDDRPEDMANTARRPKHASRPPSSGRRLGGAWVAFLLATLLAFCWQSFVAETHNHFDRTPISTAGVSARTVTAASSGGNAPLNSPANCPICREIAQSAAYLPPAPIIVPAPQPLLVWLAVTLSIGLTVERRPLGWRSRAPPRQLQA